MADTPHRSYSQYNGLLHCPKAYYLSRVVGVSEKPAWYLVAGKAVHAAIESINKQVWEQDARQDG